MKCPGCGYENFDLFETCRHCGPPLAAGEVPPVASPTDPVDDLLNLRFEPERAAPEQAVPDRRRSRATPARRVDPGGDFVEMLEDDALEAGEAGLDRAPAASPVCSDDDGGPPFSIDDDLFSRHDSGSRGVSGSAPGSVDWADLADRGPGVNADPSGPAFVLSDSGHGAPPLFAPIIDRDDEVPERYWAPEVAGLGRRALALLVDQAIVLAILAVFYLSALVALQHNGLTTDFSLPAAGMLASALPFALLAALLSLAYSMFFHGSTGRTPGKALVGIEVRTGAGAALSWSRAILRWLGAALGLVCAGVGVFWAVFEPRRRGWADLISGTVVARPQRESALGVSRR